MPKRGAERDLNKDNADHEEADEEPSTGFVKANEEEISKRRIAGLPRRAQSASRIASPNPPTSQLIGFSSSSNPLFAPLPTSNPFTAPNPTVAPTATSTAKTFASFLGAPSSTVSSATSKPPQLTPPSSSGVTSEKDDPSILKYYTSLRGLNVSLLAALAKATEEDPFVDISNILDQYKSLRLDVQNELEANSNKKSTPPAPTPQKPTFAAPAPPSGGFSAFGGFPISPTTSTDNKGGFQPTTLSSTFTAPVPPSSGFSLSVPPAQTNASSGPFSKPSNSGSSSSFGSLTSNSQIPSSVSGKSSLSPSLFAKPVEDKSTSSPNPFTIGASSTSDKNTSSTTFTFSASGEKAPSSTFSFGATPASNSSPFTFGKSGSSASTSFGSTTTTNFFGTIGAATTTSLESLAPLKVPTFGSFGKSTGSTGSIGNPVGFGFGVPTKTQESEVSTENSSDKKDSDEGTQSQTEGVAAEGSIGLITKNPHDEEGKGEEDEDTVHDARLKVFRLEEKSSSWVDLGIGIFRIKKHRETGARRILLRNSSTGKIVLNFKLYSGLKPTQNKKSLVFVGHDETGASQTYTVRLADETAATTLREILQKEIASIEIKSDD